MRCSNSSWVKSLFGSSFPFFTIYHPFYFSKVHFIKGLLSQCQCCRAHRYAPNHVKSLVSLHSLCKQSREKQAEKACSSVKLRKTFIISISLRRQETSSSLEHGCSTSLCSSLTFLLPPSTSLLVPRASSLCGHRIHFVLIILRARQLSCYSTFSQALRRKARAFITLALCLIF